MNYILEVEAEAAEAALKLTASTTLLGAVVRRTFLFWITLYLIRVGFFIANSCLLEKSRFRSNLHCKMKHYIVVVYVLSFPFSAQSISFFLAFFLHFYGTIFYGRPYAFRRDQPVTRFTLTRRS